MKSHPVGEIDSQELSHYCGVGVVITPQEIQQQVCTCIYMYIHVHVPIVQVL